MHHLHSHRLAVNYGAMAVGHAMSQASPVSPCMHASNSMSSLVEISNTTGSLTSTPESEPLGRAVHAGMLSPGELQRLSFARVLFHRPILAVMDEPVSAVGSQAGVDLLQLLLQSGIAAIVTGQSDSPLADEMLAVPLFSEVVLLQQ